MFLVIKLVLFFSLIQVTTGILEQLKLCLRGLFREHLNASNVCLPTNWEIKVYYKTIPWRNSLVKLEQLKLSHLNLKKKTYFKDAFSKFISILVDSCWLLLIEIDVWRINKISVLVHLVRNLSRKVLFRLVLIYNQYAQHFLLLLSTLVSIP